MPGGADSEKLVTVEEPQQLATITLVFEILWKLLSSELAENVSRILAQPKLFSRIVRVLDGIKRNPHPKRRSVEEQLRNDVAIVAFSIVKGCAEIGDPELLNVFKESGFFDNICSYLIVQQESPVTCVWSNLLI